MKGKEENINKREMGKSKKKEEIDYLINLPIELDVLISERKYEESVCLIEKGQRILKQIKWEVEEKVCRELGEAIDNRVSHLTKIWKSMLLNTALQKTEHKEVVDWMKRLELMEEARDDYLKGRSNVVIQRLRKVKLESDLLNFIVNLSNVFYTSLYSISDDFTQVFPNLFISGSLASHSHFHFISSHFHFHFISFHSIPISFHFISTSISFHFISFPFHSASFSFPLFLFSIFSLSFSLSFSLKEQLS